MLFYMVLLYLFQLYVGVIYLKVGLLTSFYFLGMYISLKKEIFFSVKYIFLAIEGLLLLVFFLLKTAWFLLPIFYVLSFLCGYLGGVMLLFLQDKFREQKEYLYSGEMLGASVAAIFWSSLFLPIYGVDFTLIFLICLPVICL